MSFRILGYRKPEKKPTNRFLDVQKQAVRKGLAKDILKALIGSPKPQENK